MFKVELTMLYVWRVTEPLRVLACGVRQVTNDSKKMDQSEERIPDQGKMWWPEADLNSKALLGNKQVQESSPLFRIQTRKGQSRNSNRQTRSRDWGKIGRSIYWGSNQGHHWYYVIAQRKEATWRAAGEERGMEIATLTSYTFSCWLSAMLLTPVDSVPWGENHKKKSH